MDEIYETEEEKLFKAVTNGNMQNFKELLDNVENLNVQDIDLKTPLMHAVCYDINNVRTSMVRMMLRYKCNVNIRDKHGLTALMYACMEEDRLDVVRLISRNRKCNPNIQDNEGNTAAMHAVSASNAPALRLLVNTASSKSSFDLNMTNHQGLTALGLAVRLQMSECCKVLVTEGNANTATVKDKKGLRTLLDREHLVIRENSNIQTGSNLYPNYNKAPIVPSLTLSPSVFQLSQSLVRGDTPAPEKSFHYSPFDDRIPVDGRTSVRMRKNGKSPIPVSRSNSIISRSNSKLNNYKRDQVSPSHSGSFPDSPRKMRRALTPISRENEKATPVPLSPASPVFDNRMRLPSIPSGKRLYLVNSKTVNESHQTEF